MSKNQFFLQWNSHKPNLVSNITKLLRAEAFVDVTLISEGHSIQCHRLVLSASSSLFDSMLQGTEGNYPIIILPSEIKLWHMQGIIDYMYLGELTLDKTGVNDFIKSAKLLKIRGLCDISEQFIDEKEENIPKKNDVEEKIKLNEPDTNKLRTTLDNPQQVVSTTTTDAPASINSKNLANNTNQTIKESNPQDHPPPAYQERGPILNNIEGCIQPPVPQKTTISHNIKRPASENGYLKDRVNENFKELSTQAPTSVNGNSRYSEHLPYIKPLESNILTAAPGNSNNLPSYFQNSMNRPFISDQSVTSQAFEMLKRINNSPSLSEKRARLSHPPKLCSDPPKDFYSPHRFSAVPPPPIPPLKKSATPKNQRNSAKTTPGNQQFQQFNIPSNYGLSPMHLPYPRPALPGLVPSNNMNPHLLPHPSMYLHPNFSPYATNYANNFKM